MLKFDQENDVEKWPQILLLRLLKIYPNPFSFQYTLRLSLYLDHTIFFKKWTDKGLFFVYFRSFETNNTIFTTNQCEK